jgi:hypothetical protein
VKARHIPARKARRDRAGRNAEAEQEYRKKGIQERGEEERRMSSAPHVTPPKLSL